MSPFHHTNLQFKSTVPVTGRTFFISVVSLSHKRAMFRVDSIHTCLSFQG